MKKTFLDFFLGGEKHQKNKLYTRFVTSNTDTFMGMILPYMTPSDSLTVVSYMNNNRIDSFKLIYKNSTYKIIASFEDAIVLHIEIKNISDILTDKP